MIINLPRALEDDIKRFTDLNGIEDINSHIVEIIRCGHNVAKYGFSPQDNMEKENKPLNIKKYGNKEDKSQGLEESAVEEPIQSSSTNSKEEGSKHEEGEEIKKPKRKIKITKK